MSFLLDYYNSTLVWIRFASVCGIRNPRKTHENLNSATLLRAYYLLSTCLTFATLMNMWPETNSRHTQYRRALWERKKLRYRVLWAGKRVSMYFFFFFQIYKIIWKCNNIDNNFRPNIQCYRAFMIDYLTDLIFKNSQPVLLFVSCVSFTVLFVLVEEYWTRFLHAV